MELTCNPYTKHLPEGVVMLEDSTPLEIAQQFYLPRKTEILSIGSYVQKAFNNQELQTEGMDDAVFYTELSIWQRQSMYRQH